LILKAEPGDVFVIEALGTDCWMLGENTVHAAKYRGLGGMVIDGRVRDVMEIKKIGMPVFCRGAAIRPHAPFLELVDHSVPIMCAGAQVRPGDIVVGDADGVVVVPPERIEDIVKQAKDLEALEKEQEQVILEGKSLEELNAVLKKKKIVKQ
jgi:3-hexulose-6-phosphate synthase/6-phospho-3-hexuloisomerase